MGNSNWYENILVISFVYIFVTFIISDDNYFQSSPRTFGHTPLKQWWPLHFRLLGITTTTTTTLSSSSHHRRLPIDPSTHHLLTAYTWYLKISSNNAALRRLRHQRKVSNSDRYTNGSDNTHSTANNAAVNITRPPPSATVRVEPNETALPPRPNAVKPNYSTSNTIPRASTSHRHPLPQ